MLRLSFMSGPGLRFGEMTLWCRGLYLQGTGCRKTTRNVEPAAQWSVPCRAHQAWREIILTVKGMPDIPKPYRLYFQVSQSNFLRQSRLLCPFDGRSSCCRLCCNDVIRAEAWL